MRRWFRKKDRQPNDSENEALSPLEDEPQETAAVLSEEPPPAPEGQAPEIDAPPPPEQPSALGLESEEPIIDLVVELKEEEEAAVETRKRRFRRFRERLGLTRKNLAGGLERLFRDAGK
jgi:hypothetical protein